MLIFIVNLFGALFLIILNRLFFRKVAFVRQWHQTAVLTADILTDRDSVNITVT